jgi:glycosyltransferase involved in cell wall biosynthesis
VVHVHFGYVLGEALGAARRLRLPVVVSLHGHDVTEPLSAAPDRYRREFQHVDAVVVPSEFLARAVERLGARRDMIHVIPAGVDTSRFVPSPLPIGPPEVLFVGRFVEKKGLDVLLEAWPEVRRRVAGARLRLLGYGPLLDTAAVAAEDVAVELRPSHERVREAIVGATVVVSPSRTATSGDAESLLLVNLEAQASGRPVVTTDHGGVPEFVRAGESALVVPEDDAPALAEAMVQVLSDRAVASRLAAAGPAVAAQFDVRRMTARVDQLYAALLAGH